MIWDNTYLLTRDRQITLVFVLFAEALIFASFLNQVRSDNVWRLGRLCLTWAHLINAFLSFSDFMEWWSFRMDTISFGWALRCLVVMFVYIFSQESLSCSFSFYGIHTRETRRVTVVGTKTIKTSQNIKNHGQTTSIALINSLCRQELTTTHHRTSPITRQDGTPSEGIVRPIWKQPVDKNS